VVVGEVEELCEVVVSRVVETWVDVGDVEVGEVLVAEVVTEEEVAADAIVYGLVPDQEIERWTYT
jgi:hypothetical protein